MNTIKKTMIRLLAAMLIITSCMALPAALPRESAISSVASAAAIAINKTTATIYGGGTVQLKLTGTNKTPVWSSSNVKVAKVSAKGKVTGVKAGTATITAKLGNTKYTCKVKVKSPLSASVTAVTFTKQIKKTVKITYKLKGTLAVKVANSAVAACTLKQDTANHSATLTITAKKTGSTTVTITNSKSKDVLKIKVTVKALSGDISWIWGKSINDVKNRFSPALAKSDSGNYKNSELSLQGTKVNWITIKGSTYNLYGVKIGMDFSVVRDKAEAAGFKHAWLDIDRIDGHVCDEFFEKEEDNLMLVVNFDKSQKVEEIILQPIN